MDYHNVLLHSRGGMEYNIKMNLSIGIVGLPNVGKSTLFNALLKKQVAYAANYPFATIEPNVGVVEVPDERLKKLQEIIRYKDTKISDTNISVSQSLNIPPIIPAIVEFYDIAGLVAGASQGEGLGNKFLSHIREVAAIVHVVRLFDDSDVVHVQDTVDPARDMQTIETELQLADLATLEKQREPKMNASKEETATYEVVRLLKEQLNAGVSARNVPLDAERLALVRHLNLLTMKPVIYVFNVSEKQLEDQETITNSMKKILNPATKTATYNLKPITYLYLCAKLENDVLTFSEEEQKEFLKQYNLPETGLNRLIKKAYETLSLISFLTAGEKEVRAWTIQKGTLAPQAAAVIHTDFEKHFIKADVIPYSEFVAAGGWVKAREQGKVHSVGRDYVMRDGDVVEFKVNA